MESVTNEQNANITGTKAWYTGTLYSGTIPSECTSAIHPVLIDSNTMPSCKTIFYRFPRLNWFVTKYTLFPSALETETLTDLSVTSGLYCSGLICISLTKRIVSPFYCLKTDWWEKHLRAQELHLGQWLTMRSFDLRKWLVEITVYVSIASAVGVCCLLHVWNVSVACLGNMNKDHLILSDLVEFPWGVVVAYTRAKRDVNT